MKSDLLLSHLRCRPTWSVARCLEVVGATPRQLSGWKKDPEFAEKYEEIALARKEAKAQITRRVKMAAPPRMAEEPEVRKVLAKFDAEPMLGFESACREFHQDPRQVMAAIKASPEMDAIYRAALGALVEPVEQMFIRDLLDPNNPVRREKFLGKHHPELYGAASHQEQKPEDKADVTVNILIQEANSRIRSAEIENGRPVFLDISDSELVANSQLPRALKRGEGKAPLVGSFRG